MFRNHAPPCSTGLFHGTSVHPNIDGFALSSGSSKHLWLCLVSLVYVLPCTCSLVSLVFSGSEDAISRVSLRRPLAPPWAPTLLGIRCFATMPHSAPQGFSMVLAGPSRHLWLCHVCLVCLVLPCMPLVVPKMLFRKHLCACFWHRLGLESCWGSLVSSKQVVFPICHQKRIHEQTNIEAFSPLCCPRSSNNDPSRSIIQDSQQACCFTSVSVEPLNNFSFKKSCPCKANALSCSFLSLPLSGLHNLRACSSLVWPPFLRLPL